MGFAFSFMKARDIVLTSFMFVGDVEEPELHDVTIRYGRDLDSDVYKVGHHGSYNSSSEEFNYFL